MTVAELTALRDRYSDKFDHLSHQKEEIIFRLHQLKGRVELLNELITNEEQEVEHGAGSAEKQSPETAEPSQS